MSNELIKKNKDIIKRNLNKLLAEGLKSYKQKNEESYNLSINDNVERKHREDNKLVTDYRELNVDNLFYNLIAYKAIKERHEAKPWYKRFFGFFSKENKFERNTMKKYERFFDNHNIKKEELENAVSTDESIAEYVYDRLEEDTIDKTNSKSFMKNITGQFTYERVSFKENEFRYSSSDPMMVEDKREIVRPYEAIPEEDMEELSKGL